MVTKNIVGTLISSQKNRIISKLILVKNVFKVLLKQARGVLKNGKEMIHNVLADFSMLSLYILISLSIFNDSSSINKIINIMHVNIFFYEGYTYTILKHNHVS